MRRGHGSATETGGFSYDVATGKWGWDPEVYRIHGLRPDAIEPTLAHVLDAAVPEDRERLRSAIATMVATSESFSLHYRLAAADGKERSVVLVGERAVCDPDQVTLIEGYVIDLTAEIDHLAAGVAHAAVEASAEARAVIEQAKGALMLAYGFDADAAFSMLNWWSRNRNVKVRDLAAELMRASEEGEVTEQDFRGRVDRLLHDLTSRDSGRDTGRAAAGADPGSPDSPAPV